MDTLTLRLSPQDPIVILTGAGISKESGLDTFRDAGGIWQTHPLEDLATPEGFARNPDLVQRFYNARRQQLDRVEPNAAHRALAVLEAAWPGGLTLITQNVDDLHERGGHQRVWHMHGELRRARCLTCGKSAEAGGDLTAESPCRHCGAVGRLRPDIVWFGEMPFYMTEIEAALAACALFIAIGTSGTVYPAAGFVELARLAGAETLEFNLEPSETSRRFHHRRLGPASLLVPALVEALLKPVRDPG